ncbi:MAG TPA: winged helix-turn-helix domain-containing protein, partial [Anaerolineales bacterium]|nr:winged helix-turn-helix domain-containing protein [Anaerolineales bacterium]
MNVHTNPENTHELRILEQIEQDPDATQADLAARLGVAIGTINWYVKRLVSKGHVKVTRLQRRRLRYLITPEGIAEKSRLAVEYVQVSMGMYRTIRQVARDLLAEARAAG